MEQTKKFKLQHFEKRIREIWLHIFEEIKPIDTFFSNEEPNDLSNGALVPENAKWSLFSKNDKWVAHDAYLWLKQKIDIPATWAGKKIVFNLSALCYNTKRVMPFGAYGAPPVFEPKWMGFEGLFFLDGVAYQGIDNNHQIIFLPDSVCGKTIEIAIRVWSGTDPASLDSPYAIEIDYARVGILNDALLEFYMITTAALQTLNQLPEHNPYHPSLYNSIDEAFKIVRWGESVYGIFRESVQTAFNFLNNEISSIKKDTYHCATDYIIGHTHLDVAWLWRLHQLTEKTVRSWLTALRWMDLDSEYTFLQTQPQLYADIKKHYPDVYEQIKARVKEGRWSIEGSMWVEADCNISSGEALARQLLYGKRFFKQEFGIETKTLWLPDVFGYSYALPQILKLTEVDTFITSKISWNQYNRFPHDLFNWRGMDGTDVLTTFIVIPEPKPRENWYYTYNGLMTAEVINDAWEAFSDKDICKSFIHPYGWGDGGGGTTYEQLKVRKYLQKMPGIPNIKDTTLAEFNDILHKEMDNKKGEIPIFSGELYLEYHRGTLTSQALIKKNNRKFELKLAQLENLFVWALLENKNICDKDKLRDYWYTLLKNQFHDILPGSSIHNVYVDSALEFNQMGVDISNDKEKIIDSIFISNEKYITLFNPLLHDRQDVLKIENSNKFSLNTADGKTLCSQQVRDNLWFNGITVPSLGYVTLTKNKFGTDVKTNNTFILEDNKIETPFIKLSWNKCGQIDSLTLNDSDIQLVAKDKAMNILEVLEDKPRQYDAWEIEPYAEEKTDIVTNFLGVQIVSLGEVAAVLSFRWNYKNSTIEQDWIFYSNSPQIDFETKIIWNEREQLLRAAFYGNVISNKATYDIQYGNVERPTHRNTSWDVARFEVVAHRWADLSDRGAGFSILNDCKYGHSALHNCLRITLLKSSNMPDCSADAGEHRFTYSLLPHKDTWLDAGTNKIAAELNSPVHIFENKCLNEGNLVGSLVSIDGGFVEVDALKLAEDSNDIILRIHEYAGMRSKLKINLGFSIKKWQRVNILENALSDLTNETLELHILPYEIVTLKLIL